MARIVLTHRFHRVARPFLSGLRKTNQGLPLSDRVRAARDLRGQFPQGSTPTVGLRFHARIICLRSPHPHGGLGYVPGNGLASALPPSRESFNSRFSLTSLDPVNESRDETCFVRGEQNIIGCRDIERREDLQTFRTGGFGKGLQAELIENRPQPESDLAAQTISAGAPGSTSKASAVGRLRVDARCRNVCQFQSARFAAQKSAERSFIRQ
jgi:hypothetical protein